MSDPTPLFLGINPIELADSVINAAKQYCCDGMDELEELLHSIPEFGELRTQATEGVENVMEFFLSSIDKNFDKFELYLFNHLFSKKDFPQTLSTNTTLQQEREKKRKIDDERSKEWFEEEKQLEDRVEEMKKKIFLERARNKRLKREVRQIEERKKIIQQIENELSFLKDISDPSPLSPLSSNHEKMIQEKKNLAELIKKLKVLEKTALTSDNNINKNSTSSSACGSIESAFQEDSSLITMESLADLKELGSYFGN